MPQLFTKLCNRRIDVKRQTLKSAHRRDSIWIDSVIVVTAFYNLEETESVIK